MLRVPVGEHWSISVHAANAGVRSLSFRDDTLTIGGGLGRLSFYDVRIQVSNGIVQQRCCATLVDGTAANHGWQMQFNAHNRPQRYINVSRTSDDNFLVENLFHTTGSGWLVCKNTTVLRSHCPIRRACVMTCAIR